ncbi:MAG: ATP-grasp fold amidoligase family protein, partial [Verrucomicrobiales bacterium]|nr:ATP-grasp fold amidoligase family protein [Verrucomicrobiales bacterium]
ALARGIAEASANSDREQERRLYYTGAFLVALLALVGVTFAALLISFVPITMLFGDKYAEWESVLIPSLWTGAGLLAVDLIARHTDRVREGYMEAGIAMAWVAGGNLIGAIAIFAGIKFFPSPVYLLLAVFVPNILVRLINTGFLLKKRPWLIRPPVYPNRDEMKEMVKDGFFFSATSTAVHLVEFNLCALLIGRLLGPSDVAIHFVLIMITTAFDGLLIMVGNPLWAAIVDAKTRGDQEWLIGVTRRYYQYLAALAALAGVTLIGLGPWLIPLLYGSEFAPDRLLFVGHAVFLFAIGWRHVNRYLSIGLGLLPRTVVPILAGLAIGFILGIIGLKSQGLWALYLGLGLGTMLIPGLVLPAMVWNKIGYNSLTTYMNRYTITNSIRKRLAPLLRDIFRWIPVSTVLKEKVLFAGKMGYWPDFGKPKSYSEKVNWRKLYSHNHLYIKCSDKLAVREYVKEKTGSDDYLIPVVFEGDTITPAELVALGDDIVVKATHDSGSVCIINKNSPERAEEVCAEIEKSLKYNYGAETNQWWYSNIKPRVYVEKYLCNENGAPPWDFKFFVFKQSATRSLKIISSVIFERGTPNYHRSFYNENRELIDWKGQDIQLEFAPNHQTPFPDIENYDEMLEAVVSLAEDFDHVRVDMYQVNGRIYFGELTFSQGGGRSRWSPREFDYALGDYWAVNRDHEHAGVIRPGRNILTDLSATTCSMQ